MWKQIIIMYGKKIKNLIYANKKTSKIFNTSFFNCLRFLENRLNTVLLRLNFFSKLLLINNNIKKKLILVNNKTKNYYYIMQIGDIINCFKCFNLIKSDFGTIFFKNRWQKYKWRKWKKYCVNKKNVTIQNVPKIFWLTKRNLICNYIEVNYIIFSALYLRNPKLGEVLLNNNKKMVTSNMFKFFYYY